MTNSQAKKIDEQIFDEETRENTNPKENNFSLLGKKHTKYSKDNIIKKLVGLLIRVFIEYINSEISTLPNFKNKKLYQLRTEKPQKTVKAQQNQNQEQKIQNIEIPLDENDQDNFQEEVKCEKKNVEYYQELLHRFIGAIISGNKSSRVHNNCYENNWNIVLELCSLDDQEKRIRFQKIFGFTFMECFNHFVGNARYEELNGMETFKHRQDKDISLKCDNVINICKNFEYVILTTQKRKPRKEE